MEYVHHSYVENLQILPIQADSKLELVWWTIDLHNLVNKSTGKPILSREEALQKIISMYTEYPNNPEAYELLYIGILINLIIIFLKIKILKIE